MTWIWGGEGEMANQFLIILTNGKKQGITIYKILDEC